MFIPSLGILDSPFKSSAFLVRIEFIRRSLKYGQMVIFLSARGSKTVESYGTSLYIHMISLYQPKHEFKKIDNLTVDVSMIHCYVLTGQSVHNSHALQFHLVNGVLRPENSFRWSLILISFWGYSFFICAVPFFIPPKGYLSFQMHRDVWYHRIFVSLSWSFFSWNNPKCFIRFKYYLVPLP